MTVSSWASCSGSVHARKILIPTLQARPRHICIGTGEGLTEPASAPAARRVSADLAPQGVIRHERRGRERRAGHRRPRRLCDPALHRSPLVREAVRGDDRVGHEARCDRADEIGRRGREQPLRKAVLVGPAAARRPGRLARRRWPSLPGKLQSGSRRPRRDCRIEHARGRGRRRRQRRGGRRRWWRRGRGRGRCRCWRW